VLEDIWGQGGLLKAIKLVANQLLLSKYLNKKILILKNDSKNLKSIQKLFQKLFFSKLFFKLINIIWHGNISATSNH